jgi:hypothetical protein
MTGGPAAELTEPSLTIGAAARRLGVAVETLRSWERRYGLRPGSHVAGTHRRYSPTDMARLERFCRLVGKGIATAHAAAIALGADVPGVADGARRVEDNDGGAASAARAHTIGGHAGGGRTLPVGRAGGDAARGLARCAVRLDTAQVLELLESTIERDGVAPAWQETIEPALRAVGRKWNETSGRYVEVEHLLSWCVSVALHRVRPPRQPEAGIVRRRVLLACAPDEWHCLPLEVLHAALAQSGVTSCMLGAAVPADALREAMRRVEPRLVVVWSQVPATARLPDLPLPPDPARCRIAPAGPGWSTARGYRGPVLSSLGMALDACRD